MTESSGFLQESFIAFFRFIEVGLAGNLPGGVHIEDGDAAVDDLHPVAGRDIGDGPPAS